MNEHGNAPRELLDPDGEGIYLLSDQAPSPLYRAAWMFGCSWREVEHRTAFMRPRRGSDEWEEYEPRWWDWWLPRRTPAVYAYCTPPVESPSGGRQA